MDFNTLLPLFGLEGSNFNNKEPLIEEFDGGYEVEIEQAVKIDRECPRCKSKKCVIKEYKWVTYRASTNNNQKVLLRVRLVRYKCKDCGKTFGYKLTGFEANKEITPLVYKMLKSDFVTSLTFSQLADKYKLSKTQVIKFFDKEVPFVKRLPLPKMLCIDEFYFSHKKDMKYCAVLIDYETGDVIDIIKNRQLDYLKEYFSAISQKELNNVRFFISDMYDAYSTIHRRYFPRATYVIDLFHILQQTTNAINKVRAATMNKICQKGSIEYNFMKSHWKCFICKTENIPDELYFSKIENREIHYDEMVHRCLSTNPILMEGYNIMQDLFKYSRSNSYTEAVDFIEWIVKRLKLTQQEDFIHVGDTYLKWAPGIANALARNQTGYNFTNAIAESRNNNIKTILKSAYGYQNFPRFRKRALLMLNYNSFQ